jgi:hypothetical protein
VAPAGLGIGSIRAAAHRIDSTASVGLELVQDYSVEKTSGLFALVSRVRGGSSLGAADSQQRGGEQAAADKIFQENSFSF